MQTRSSFSGPFRAVLAALSLSLANAAFSQEYFSPDNLVPSPWYLSDEWADMGGGVEIRLPAVQILGGRVAPPPVGFPTTTTFDLAASVELKPGPPIIYHAPGIGTMVLSSINPGPPQLVATEMLQLDIAGGDLPAGLMIRESPTLASLGQTTIREVAGGYMVDSFFDVFFEISVSGGQDWLPAVQSVRMHGAASPVPEPASLAAIGLGLAGLMARRRRR